MREQPANTTSRRLALAACVALLTAGCGSAADAGDGSSASSATPTASPSSAAADTSLGRGAWLLSLSTAGGADAEKATTTYITYNPATGTAHARQMPGVSTPNADVVDAALLVSTDHKWAIPDTGTSRAVQHSGRLVVYSTSTAATTTIDLRQRSGDTSVQPLGWAFDPQQPETLRVVDSKNRVWSVAVSGGRARQTDTLAKGPWVFADGFNHNTGKPYVESITDNRTRPPGNGTADTSPITRAGGTVMGSGSSGLAALPTSPCRLASAFKAGDGTTWTFCADSATIKTYVLAPGGKQWSAFGKPSTPVAPIAAGFGFAIPSQG